jgi:hypothetical protein
MASKSVSWVKKVSAGLKPLTEEAALALSSETGVGVEWLLNGDPTAPPKAEYPSKTLSPDSTYTYEFFEAHRASMEVGARAKKIVRTVSSFAELAARYLPESQEELDSKLVDRCSKVLAQTRNAKRGSVIRWRLKNFLDALAAEIEVSVKPQPSMRTSGKPPRRAVKRHG